MGKRENKYMTIAQLAKEFEYQAMLEQEENPDEFKLPEDPMPNEDDDDSKLEAELDLYVA